MRNTTPAINRHVLYNGTDGKKYAAIITAVHEAGLVDLVTFGSTSVYFQLDVIAKDMVPEGGSIAGSYEWPEF